MKTSFQKILILSLALTAIPPIANGFESPDAAPTFPDPNVADSGSASNGAEPTRDEINQMSKNIEKQATGNYGELSRRPAGPLGTQQDAWRNPRKNSGQIAPGVVRYSWSQAHIMSIQLRDFMTTTIIFPHWEKIASFFTGDPYVFQADQAQANVLVLRSNNPGADTNFTAIGESGFVYSFYVRSESWNSKNISDFVVYVEAPNPNSYWASQVASGSVNNMASGYGSGNNYSQYPGSNVVINTTDGKSVQVPDYIRDILFKPEELRFDMKIFAKTEEDAEIAPERVFRDNQFTYFDYGDRSDSVLRPVIYQVVDEVDTHVNTRTAGPTGNIIIAEAVGDFTLRNGRRVVCVRKDIKNESATKTVLIEKKRK